MQEQGYKFTLDWCHDDQPIYMKTRSGGRILSIPYSQEINDIPSIIARHDSAKDFADMIIDQFDEMLEQATGKGPPLVLGIALHPYIVGQPYRLRHLRRALKHVVETANKHEEYMYGDEWNGYPTVGRTYKTWLTTAGDIAHHILAYQKESIPGGSKFDPERMTKSTAACNANAAEQMAG